MLTALLLFTVAPFALAQPSLLGDVQAERARYGPEMTQAQVAALLNAVAARNPGWGLLAKPQGFNCPAVQGPVACDILVWAPGGLHFDVLIDAEGGARPTWDNKGPIDMARFIAPVGAGGEPPTPVPPSGPPPMPPAVDLTGLYQRLVDIQAQQTALAAQAERIYADLAARDDRAARQLDAHDERLRKHDDEPPGWLARRLRSGSTYAVIGSALAAWFGRDAVK